MGKDKLNKKVNRQIEEAVAFYSDSKDSFSNLAQAIVANLDNSKVLKPFIHSIKYRAKDPDKLKSKLERIAKDCLANHHVFDINKNNLFEKIGDLAGVRLLHLHTSQVETIHKGITGIVEEYQYHLVGKPTAYTWDIENSDYFSGVGLDVSPRKSMYTSIHYNLFSNTKTKMQCELQVRTLVEEIWGEVSHVINYPNETNILACREQLKVLARISSGVTRLVDSIFATYQESNRKQTV